MAVCKVLRSVGGWNKGDDVELFGERLLELARDGVVEIVVPDVELVEPAAHIEVKEEEVKAVVRPSKRKTRKVVN